jgi:recombination protein RecA
LVKNKIAAPFREVEVDIFYGKGISRESDLLDLGVQKAVVEKSGSWFSFQGERIGQGRENARQALIDKPELSATIEKELRKTLGLIRPDTNEKLGPISVSKPQRASANAS